MYNDCNSTHLFTGYAIPVSLYQSHYWRHRKTEAIYTYKTIIFKINWTLLDRMIKWPLLRVRNKQTRAIL